MDPDDISGDQPTMESLQSFLSPPLTPDFCLDGGGWQGWHCEASVIRSLLSILLWDIYYGEVDEDFSNDEIFLSIYQGAPLDFSYPSFYNRR